MQKSNQVTQKPVEVKEHCRMKTNPLNDSLMRISKSKFMHPTFGKLRWI